MGLAKILTKKLESYIPLPYTFNVNNTVQLLNDLIDIPYDSSIKFASFDITNMYSSIPTKELLRIINTICEEQGMSKQTKQEITELSQTLVEQNYLFPRHYLHTECRSRHERTYLFHIL
jgi:hypothetical protein